MDIRFGDHASFHRAAAGMVGGAATLGLALHPLTPLAPLVGGLLGMAIGTSYAYGKPRWGIAAAGAACAPLFAMNAMNGWLAAGSNAAHSPMAAPMIAAM